MSHDPAPDWSSEVLDDLKDALREHYFTLYDIDTEAQHGNAPVTVLYVEIEEAHIGRYLAFDLSRRNVPGDWQERRAPIGPGSPSALWAERMAEEYDGLTWHVRKHQELLEAVQLVLHNHGHGDCTVDVAYVSLMGERVLQRLLQVKERHHSWKASSGDYGDNRISQ
ncbi:hypothetical protein [Kocuria rosea]|uniref:hypothetical protein n=1 Tax=Kocuria rosea TaxID=1275 RepID=UPI0011A955A7|nr:hypothetical protein [Kocuria rosea]